jgi:pimeloyl-ACP methyl ester carboxylesterase
MKEGFVDSGGVRLHTIDWGGAGRPLVFLAGLGDTAQLFRGLAPRFAHRFRVVGLTRRGHGRSERPGSRYDLDTLVEDIRHTLDALGIHRAILAGHSLAGIEMPRFAVRYPQRVEAIVYLDALFPRLEAEPDFSDDPVWGGPRSSPTAEDLASREAYFAYHKRTRPELARIWCAAVEADLLDKATIQDDGRLESHHDDALMNRIAAAVWPARQPEYGQVTAPMLAIVPDGNYHPGVPLDATDELRRAANHYWQERILPWIRLRTELVRQAAPSAHIAELDTPNHHIYIAREDETVEAMNTFLGG